MYTAKSTDPTRFARTRVRTSRCPSRDPWGSVLLLASLVLLRAGSAGAAMLVNSTTSCTLADAVEAANTVSNVGGCTYDEPIIELSEETYEVAGPTLVIKKNVTVTIQGVDGSRAATITRAATESTRLFNVRGTLFLRHVTLTGGNGQYAGGAVKVFGSGTLDVVDSSFDGNSTADRGGAVHNKGTLTVHRSTFADNSATYGGAIYNLASLGITHSILETNSAVAEGGALYVADGGTADIASSTFAGNSAVLGGAVFAHGDSSGTSGSAPELWLESSTFSANTSNYGGALFSKSGDTQVEICTFKDNAATIAGGTFFREWGTVAVGKSALAGASPCFGAITSNGDNRAEDSTCGLTDPSDQQNVALHLSELVDTHGGWAPVHVPLCPWTGPNGECDSPLIEQYSCCGQAESCAPVLRDQRDQFPRKDTANPLGQGDLCDVGAYESICSSGNESVGTYSIPLVGGQTGPSTGMVLNNGGCSSEDVGFGGQSSSCSIVWTRYGGVFEFQNVWFLRQSCLDQYFDGGIDCFSDPEGCKDTCAFNPNDAADFSAFTDENDNLELIRPAQSLPSASYVVDVPNCTWSVPDGESTATLRSVIELAGSVFDYWDPEMIPPNPN